MVVDNTWVLLVIFGLIFGSYSCSTDSKERSTQERARVNNSEIEFIETPAGTGSGEPNLFATENGDIFLSWVESNEGLSELKFSKFLERRWTDPILIAKGDNWFINWADFPSIVVKDGKMAAHYLVMNGEDTFAYGINMVFSGDNGKTWSDPVIPHETETKTEHGFVSLLPYGTGYFATWLDGRFTGGGHGHKDGNDQQPGAMSLRGAVIDFHGMVQEEFELDDRTCDCCQTSAVITSKGPIVAYRDRTEDEIRDISIVRLRKEGWTKPESIFNDNWQIEGCPVNGPVLSGHKNKVALCWFTMSDGNPEIKLVFSDNGGDLFGDPVKIDRGNAIGRIDMTMLDDGSVFVVWMETNEGAGQIYVARVTESGKRIEHMVLAENISDRSSGFPRIESSKNQIIIVWRDMTTKPQIRSAVVKI